MRRFQLVRNVDETGISGTGKVAEGVLFGDGTACMRWLTATTSTAVYRSMADVEAIHGHGGKTVVRWVDSLEEPFIRGKNDAVQDMCEGCLWSSIGGRDRGNLDTVPGYIDAASATQYLNGYYAVAETLGR